MLRVLFSLFVVLSVVVYFNIPSGACGSWAKASAKACASSSSSSNSSSNAYGGSSNASGGNAYGEGGQGGHAQGGQGGSSNVKIEKPNTPPGNYPEFNFTFGEYTEHSWNTAGEEWIPSGPMATLEMVNIESFRCAVVQRHSEHMGTVEFGTPDPRYSSGEIAACWGVVGAAKTYGDLYSDLIKATKKLGGTHAQVVTKRAAQRADTEIGGWGITAVFSQPDWSVNPSYQKGAGHTKGSHEPYMFTVIYQDTGLYQPK